MLEITRSFKKSLKAVKRNFLYFKRARKRFITLTTLPCLVSKNFPISVINTAPCIKPYEIKSSLDGVSEMP